MFGRHHTPSAHPSLLMFHIDCPIAWISPSLVLYRSLAVVLLLWWRDHNRMDSYWVSMVNVSQPPIASGTRSLTAAVWLLELLWRMMRFCTTKSMWLRSLRQSERTTVRDPVQHKRWTYPCYRTVNMEHQQRWTCWWCTTPSKHLAKGDK